MMTPEESSPLLDAAMELAPRRQEGLRAEEAQAFIRHYFGQVDLDDIAGRSAEDLYGCAMAHCAFAREFAGGAPKLRVYNPSLAEHGWQSAHTVIEVVNDDMPFLVDSVSMVINRQGYGVQMLVHPIFRVSRSPAGQWQGIGGEAARSESFIHVEVERETDSGRLRALAAGIGAALTDVRAAVRDWRAMRERMAAVVAGMAGTPAGLDAAEVAETRAFLQWVHDNHYTFLGCRDYDLVRDGDDIQLAIVPKSGLGILTEPVDGGLSASFRELPRELRAIAIRPEPLLLTKANSRSTVHRPGYLDYIGVRRFDAAGKVIGERRFVGLYTSSAYSARPEEIPLLRRKAAAVIAQAGFPPASHMGKNLVTILETFPRDELFQIDTATLFETVMGILRLGDRRRTRLFLRRDHYARFYSCLIYVPRENYSTDTRLRIQEILLDALGGQSAEYTLRLSDAVLARIHMLVRADPKSAAPVDVRALEDRIVQGLRRWDDELTAALAAEAGSLNASATLRAWRNAFPPAYRAAVSARSAVRDIATVETLVGARTLALSLYRPVEADTRTLRLRLYNAGGPIRLSSSLPMLENMGVSVEDEQSFALAPEGRAPVHVHDFGLACAVAVDDLERAKPLFEEAFARVWARESENDGFNRLTLAAGLSSDEVTVLRAYARYLRQAGFTFSQAYLAQILAAHPALTAMLIALFHLRFDLDVEGERAAAVSAMATRIAGALEGVSNLDEDRILRRFLAVIEATVRVNACQRDAGGRRKPWLAFKLVSAKVPELPEPRPLYEIFVYSPRVEAIHLRGGKVARGGLRWSDRMEDFRTEVLGLMKAQMVKNAVIVPVGSKGGFVVKNPPAGDREALQKEGIECYRIFLRGLLDLTDNVVQGAVVPPADVVRHDDDDPYLVVAADKGTATFSDIANAVSAEYGFWLGDAFASGGSAGYDHKKMAITARGAWESVRRSFRELSLDTQATEFTVVGVGDMSGDVFGNGMLLSPKIRLVAAFDHRHIFLDPEPDAAAGFAERTRLFALARSSWADYDTRKLSAGGGVYPRTLKSIALSAEVRRLLDVESGHLPPTELIQAILRARVDLLYNGGIGTYVKATHETHADVGDRANDAVRINGRELNCRVVCEGGNLGFTQLGRVEYARFGAGGRGGRIHTDAIDNSAGVDCSDHEVNIKILLAGLVEQGEMTPKQRNSLLAAMTDDVARLVLADNYHQTQSLAVAGMRPDKLLDAQQAFMRALERAGRLNRRVEFLPDDEQIAERRARREGLTAPERAVLLAYSKMVLFDQIASTALVADDYLEDALLCYFPPVLRERHGEALRAHPLRREITATVVVNAMVNRVGSVFVHRMQEATGATPGEVVRAYLLVRDIFSLEELWRAIDALDYKVPAALQSTMLIDVGRLVLRATLWFLRRRRERRPMGEVVTLFRPGVRELYARFPELLSPADRRALDGAVEALATKGVERELGLRAASAESMFVALDIVETAVEHSQPVEAVARIYFSLAGELEIRWIAEAVAALPTDTSWQAQARNALRDDLSIQQRAIATAVVRTMASGTDPAAVVAGWLANAAQPLARLRQMLGEFRTGPAPDLAMLSVLLRELRGLV